MTLLFGIILLTCICLSPALIVEKDVSPIRWSEHQALFEKFEFDVGGSIEIAGTIKYDLLRANENQGSVVYIYPEKESRTMGMKDDLASLLCTNKEHNLNMGFVVPLNGVKYNFTVESKEIYSFYVVVCELSTSWNAHVKYTLYSTQFKNQIPLSSLPLPVSYSFICGLWATLLVSWCIFLKISSFTTPVHWAMAIAIFLKLVTTSVLGVYWANYAINGVNSHTLELLKNLLFTVAETMFFFLMYLFSKGWRTVRAGLPSREVRSTFVALIVLLFTLLFFSFYNTDYYWLSLIVIYFFLLPKFFSSISFQTHTLSNQVSFFERSSIQGIDSVIASFNNKSRAFTRVRNCIIAYLVVSLLVDSVFKAVMGLVWVFAWIPVVSCEVFYFAMVAFICVTLAPLNNGVWLTHPRDLAPLLRAQNIINHAEEADHNNATNNHEPWDLTKTFVIEWPNDKHTSTTSTTTTTGLGPGEGITLNRVPLSLAYEEKYVREQENPNKDDNKL